MAAHNRRRVETAAGESLTRTLADRAVIVNSTPNSPTSALSVTRARPVKR